MMSKPLAILGGAALAALLCNCTSLKPKGDELVISVSDQRLVLMDAGVPIKSYKVSTSKFGLGSKSRSYKTPLGKLYVHEKIGGGARSGTVFKSRRPTGEILRPNTAGRDPIVSRILWLEGLERSNRNTMERMIYIHGTPQERSIGRPASYGCVRMKSRDVIDLYDRIGVGTEVNIKRTHLKIAEIPIGDRALMVAALDRRGNVLPAPRRSSEVVYAAAKPAPPRVMASTPPAAKPPRTATAPSDSPKRRGAFSKVSAAISEFSSRAITRVASGTASGAIVDSGQ
jgi:hypothetical protein